MKKDRVNEIWTLLLLTITVILFISLASFDKTDLYFYTSDPNSPVKNFAGIIGAYLSGILFFVFGKASFAFPLLLLAWVAARFGGRLPEKVSVKIFGSIIFIVVLSTIFSIISRQDSIMRFTFGGIVGLGVSNLLIKYFGIVGSYIITISLLVLSFILATEFLLFGFVVGVYKNAKRIITSVKSKVSKKQNTTSVRPKPRLSKEPLEIVIAKPSKKPDKIRESQAKPKVEKKAPFVNKEAKLKNVELRKEEEQKRVKKTEYTLPPLDVLDSPPPIEERQLMESLETNSKILEETLSDFGIEVKVVKIEQGPVITRYELEPAPGIKVSKISTLSDNIALAMKAQSVRVVAPIPGKGTVGVEVPNSKSTVVYLKEVLESKEFQEASSSKLTVALGKDISGHPVIADLADMPHLLIAGATGSGKTVCVNSLIASLLFNATPDELKFLMVDPKMVELSIYNNIPHLLCPVVTEPRKVSLALYWIVNEMENRYKLFAESGSRNIYIYNTKTEQEGYNKLPYIIVIIDELADLMAVAQQDIENAITRLAQLSRAVGIHIILATQRPSVDVITGVIKANFPARISFKVASKVDSRTVLDMNGADKLMGKGDMLFIEPGASRPIRVQGSLVSDAEIERLVNYIKSQRTPEYNTEILKDKRTKFKTFEKDEVYEEAVKLVLQTRQASVSMLQRRLGLGYTRAARLIDMMENEGIVGPYAGSKPREILIEEYKSEQGSEEETEK